MKTKNIGKGVGNIFFIIGLVLCLVILMSVVPISANSNSDLVLTRTEYNMSIAVENVGWKGSIVR